MDPLRPSRCGILKHFRCSCYFDCLLEILLGLTTGTTAPALLSGSNTIWYWKWGQNIREPNLASRAGSEWWMYWCGWRKLSLPWAVYLCTVGSTTISFQWELRPWCWWTNSCLFGWWPETQLFSQVMILRILIWYVLCSSRCLVFAQNWIGKIAGYSGTTCRWFLMWLNVNQMVFTLQCHKSVSSHLIQLI